MNDFNMKIKKCTVYARTKLIKDSSDTFLSPIPFTKSLMSMSLAELISYCLIDPQTALIHHRVIQYLTLLICLPLMIIL